MRIDRLTIFNHLWAIAGFCEWTRWKWSETGWSWMLLVGALALALYPNSVVCLAALAGAQVVFTTFAANQPWNHGLFMALMNLAILASIARCLVERRRAPGAAAPALDPEILVETFAPVLRLSLVLLYLLAFFHKLNTDFLDPDVSCTGTLLGWLNRSYRILPLERWAVVLGIWATLFVELTVPLLLCFRRTAYVGLAIGAAFHLFLSQFGGLHGFAAMLFALYFLFLPTAFTAGVADRFSALLDVVDWPALRRVGLPLLAVAMLVLGWVLGRFFGINLIYRGLLFWDLWFLGVVVVFGRELVRIWTTPAAFSLRPRWAPLWVIPAIVALNGMSPYVGLKTETSWAMYSNLRTEVHPNHLVMPASAKLFGYQDDLVEILATSLPALQGYVGRDVRLTFFEFRRLCSAATDDFTVSYRRNGADHTLAVVGGVASDPAVRAHPWLAGTLLRFRPVDVGAHAQCRH
jgi:hypothetical protein